MCTYLTMSIRNVKLFLRRTGVKDNKPFDERTTAIIQPMFGEQYATHLHIGDRIDHTFYNMLFFDDCDPDNILSIAGVEITDQPANMKIIKN